MNEATSPAVPPLLPERLSALAHPARMEILRSLASVDCCCCKDVVGQLDLAQSTVSQHLKVLVKAGLVRYTPNGPRSLYRLDRPALAGLSASINELLSTCCLEPPEAGAKEKE